MAVDNAGGSGVNLHESEPEDELSPADRKLLEAADVGLFAERVGLPLEPWQQAIVDNMMQAPS